MKKKYLVIFSILMVAATAFAGCSDKSPPSSPTYRELSDSLSDSAYLGDPEHGDQPSEKTIPVEVGNGSYLVRVVAVLTWTDDEASDDSDPDQFKLTVKNGEMSKMAGSDSGEIKVTLETDGGNSTDGGDIETSTLGFSVDVIVECIECGFTPDTKNWGLILLGHHDPGNEYSLDVNYDFLEPE